MAELIEGMRALKRKLKVLERKAPAVFLFALYEDVRDHIFDPSQELVPVLTGRLKGSGKLVAEALRFGGVVTVGYGTSYGLGIHERTELDAARAARGSKRRSKFLEIPFNSALPGMGERLAVRVAALLRSGQDVSAMPTIRGERERDASGRFK